MKSQQNNKEGKGWHFKLNNKNWVLGNHEFVFCMWIIIIYIIMMRGQLQFKIIIRIFYRYRTRIMAVA